MNSRERLAALQHKQRAAKGSYGPRLSAAQKAPRRALMLLYPRPHHTIQPDPDNHPFLDLPFADNRVPTPHPRKQPISPTPQSAADKDFEEFAHCPRFCAVDREISEKKGRTVLKFWYEDPNTLD
jgi:hypothetical protein